jgi:prepilin-type N-terminal cleavage/methylation domain-containing protein
VRSIRVAGFTLLELVITLAVIAILATLALPSFLGETRMTKAGSEVRTLFSDLRIRLEQHLQEHGAYPPTAGESIWNPAGSPGTTRVPFDLTIAQWQPLQLRLSGEDTVYCRYTFATGSANDGANIGPKAAGFGFAAPATGWYYLLAQCDMDGDPAVLSWYFASSTNPKIKALDEGR